MERSPEAVDFGINSTYLHAHKPKINSSSVKIVKVLKKFSKSSQKVLLPFSRNCGHLGGFLLLFFQTGRKLSVSHGSHGGMGNEGRRRVST